MNLTTTTIALIVLLFVLACRPSPRFPHFVSLAYSQSQDIKWGAYYPWCKFSFNGVIRQNTHPIENVKVIRRKTTICAFCKGFCIFLMISSSGIPYKSHQDQLMTQRSSAGNLNPHPDDIWLTDRWACIWLALLYSDLKIFQSYSNIRCELCGCWCN